LRVFLWTTLALGLIMGYRKLNCDE